MPGHELDQFSVVGSSGRAKRIGFGQLDERAPYLVVGRSDATFGQFVGSLPAPVEIGSQRAQVGFPPGLLFGLSLFAL